MGRDLTSASPERRLGGLPAPANCTRRQRDAGRSEHDDANSTAAGGQTNRSEAEILEAIRLIQLHLDHDLSVLGVFVRRSFYMKIASDLAARSHVLSRSHRLQSAARDALVHSVRLECGDHDSSVLAMVVDALVEIHLLRAELADTSSLAS